VQLLDFIACLEAAIGKKAVKNMLPMQAGDVLATYADTEGLRKAVGFAPSTPLKVGLERFAQWYLSVGRSYS
jgi:UDP-glucuronate 4-epimerase